MSSSLQTISEGQSKGLPAQLQNGALSQLEEQATSKLILGGDLSSLSEPQRLAYYNAYCRRLGLDPVTRPFKLIRLQGKLTMYPDKGLAEQLNRQFHISHQIVSKGKEDDGTYMVTVRGVTGDRFEEATGGVWVDGLKGDDLVFAKLKAETRAKRRATLALCGLGNFEKVEENTTKVEVKQVAQAKAIARVAASGGSDDGDSSDVEAVEIEPTFEDRLEAQLEVALENGDVITAEDASIQLERYGKINNADTVALMRDARKAGVDKDVLAKIKELFGYDGKDWNSKMDTKQLAELRQALGIGG
jgi:hypothetical protein